MPSGASKLMRRAAMAVAATLVAATLSAVAVEVWVRVSWDEQRGRPGFYLSDPELGQRLSPGYDGWFAGVPVRINALGFRDQRDYDVQKPPGAFRILVLGDSVTFGHGTRSDTTYPFLLEQRLRAWKPEVEWQVWNLGVPGYATSQELAYLERVAERYQPDLVVVGFYQNDLTGNAPRRHRALTRRATSAIQNVLQRWFYSYEFYKRAALVLQWRLFTDDEVRQRLEHLVTQEIPLGRKDYSAGRESQDLSDVDVFSDDEIARFVCDLQPTPDLGPADRLRARLQAPDAEMAAWLDAVRGFQERAARQAPALVFFINMAPEVCVAADRFYDGGSLAVDEVIRGVLGNGVPAVSSIRAFLAHRPSQMPGASGHAVGNANRVKADVLFAFLRADVLPGLLSPRR